MLDGKFIRGTTPTHTFVLPFSVDLLADLTVTYKQKRRVLVKRTMEECELWDNVVAVTLTQEESLSFLPDEIAEVQIKIFSEGGDVLASPRYRLGVEDVLDEGVFSV